MEQLMVLGEIIKKLVEPLRSVVGWVSVTIAYFFTFLGEAKSLLGFIVIAVVIDTILGIIVALRVRKQKIESARARECVFKLFVYVSIFLVFVFVDKTIINDSDVFITLRIVTSLILLCEGWSIMGNSLILYPKMPFLRLFKRFLLGEMAKKMNLSEEETKEIMEEREDLDKIS